MRADPDHGKGRSPSLSACRPVLRREMPSLSSPVQQPRLEDRGVGPYAASSACCVAVVGPLTVRMAIRGPAKVVDLLKSDMRKWRAVAKEFDFKLQ
jgi:hypothetical protein